MFITTTTVTTTANANPKLIKYTHKEIEENIDSLIAGSLPYLKSIFNQMFFG